MASGLGGGLAACGGNVVVDAATSGAGGAGAGATTSNGSTGSGGSGGATATTGTASSSGPSATSATSTTSTTAGGPACPSQPPTAGPCAPSASTCPAVNQNACLAQVSQANDPVFGMRIAQLTVQAPPSLATGTVGSVLTNSLAPNDPSCNQLGAGTFSWLLRFDTNKNTITTGAASSPPGPPYSFAQGAVSTGSSSYAVQPAVLGASLDDCQISTTTPGDVTLPVYLGGASSLAALVLPLHQLQFFKGSFSGDHACIGSFNALGLSPANSCQPQGAGQEAYIDGANLSSFMILAETDTVIVAALGQSLCVLLSGSPGQYGDSGNPQHCKKTATGEILFQGDWCSTTNSPATPACHDALQFNASFAAVGVTIH